MKILLILALAISSLGFSIEAKPLAVTNAVTQELIKDLGDGFQTKVRYKDEYELILIRFPEQYHWKQKGDGAKFLTGLSIGLQKAFSCAAFTKCPPKVSFSEDGDIMFISIFGQESLVQPMDQGDDVKGVYVGISVVRLKGVNL